MNTPDPRADAEFFDLPRMLADAAALHPQSLAVLDGERRVSYAAFDGLLNRTAAALQRAGLGPG
jgi:long-chain acyl-CoA synthetase